MATEPRSALIWPWFSILAATSATEPPVAVWMLPRLVMAERLSPSNTKSPAWNLSVEMSKVEATRDPTLTEDPAAKVIPAGLTRKTRPLAVMLPRISEGLPPTTRFKADAVDDGCTKRTLLPAPMEKLCQSTEKL